MDTTDSTAHHPFDSQEGGIVRPLLSGPTEAARPGAEPGAGRAAETPLFDRHQRAAIAERRNAVVSAGAGSGKTAVLSERYCRLVQADQLAVDRILTLTFTRKAAAEMHERIYRRLSESTDQFVQHQLARFDQAEISTLDSFCGRIVRSRSAHFGVAPSFTVDERENQRLSYRVALDFIGANASDPAMTRFLADNGFEAVLEAGLARLATEEITVARPVSFERMFADQAARLFAAAAELLVRVAELRATVLDAAAEGDAWLREFQQRLAALELPEPALFTLAGDRIGQGDLDVTELAEQAERAADQLAPVIEMLAAIDLRGGSRSKIAVVAAKEQARQARAEHLPRLQSIRFSLRSLEDQHRLFGLLERFQQQVLRARRLAGVLTYHDVVVMAIELLRQEPELRSYYKQQFDRIMIDEFQDNNRLQKELLYLLAERPELCSAEIPAPEQLIPDKLFFVGDAKQSIYRFRGADVGVFRGLAAELAANGGAALALEANYRTHPNLVRFFNAVFAGVFPEPGADYEAEFVGIEPQHAFEHREPKSAQPSVTVAWFDSSANVENGAHETAEVAEAGAQEAYYVARYISAAVEDGRLAISTRDGVRAARYDDFAIVLRSTGNQMQFERMLRLCNVPYTASGMRSLFLDAPAHDIYSVLQLCVHPGDRVSYAATLRSPFVGLSDHGMLEVLLAEQLPFAAYRFSRAADQERYDAARERFAALRAHADRVPVAEMVQTLWFEHGYRYSLLKSGAYHSYLEYYRYLFELAAVPPGQTLAQFLDRVRENLGEFKRLGELDILPEDQSGVRIMTIHAAKGLEFPVVVLADAGNAGRGDQGGGVPYYASSSYGICLNLKPEADNDRVANYFYLEGREEEQRKAEAEARRLLYVALTRAESHVVVSGVLHKRNRKSNSSHLAMLMDALGAHPENPGAFEPAVRFEMHSIKAVGERELRGDGRAATVPIAALASEPEVVERPSERYEYAATELSRRYAALRSAAVSKSGTPGRPATSDTPGTQNIPGPPDTALQRELVVEDTALAADPVLTNELRRTAFGTLVHRVIDWRLDLLRRGLQHPDDPGAYRELAATELIDELEDHELGLVLADAVQLALTFEESELGRLCIGAHTIESEVAFTMPLAVTGHPVWVHGKIDLLVRARGVRECMVIDLKTDLELRAEDYLLQLAIYRDAAASITGMPVRCYLFWLRAGRKLEVRQAPEPAQAAAELLGRA